MREWRQRGEREVSRRLPPQQRTSSGSREAIVKRGKRLAATQAVSQSVPSFTHTHTHTQS